MGPRGVSLGLGRDKGDYLPEYLLEKLKMVQHHQVRLATGTLLSGVTAISAEQRSLFEAIDVPPPTRGKLPREL